VTENDVTDITETPELPESTDSTAAPDSAAGSATGSALTERSSLKIFLTGATSPMGGVLTKHLVDAGHDVTGLTEGYSTSHIVKENGGHPVYGDLLHAGELKNIVQRRQIDVVIHLQPQLANQIPLRGADWQADQLEASTKAITEAAAAGGAKFYVHTSYAFVYGDQHGQWVDETTRPHLGENDALLRSALRAERIALDAAVPSCVLRLGYLYGPASDALHNLVDALSGSRPIVSGSGLVNFVQMDDAAEAIRRAAEIRSDGAILNITDGSPITTAAFLDKLTSTVGISAPGSLPKFVQRFVVSKQQQELMGLSARVRNTRAQETLGWAPRFDQVSKGLDDTLMTWRGQPVE
jgi:nucleoside-diphosphate-sugar epimerase